MKTSVTIAYIFLFLLFAGVKTATAQDRSPEDVTGKIEGRLPGNKGWHFEMLNNLNRDSRKYYPTIKANLLKVLTVMVDASAVKPPKGFEINPSLAAYPAGDNDGVLGGSIDMLCFNYAKNLYGDKGLHKQDESHGGLFFSINDLKSIASEDFKNECADAGVPIFFIKPDIKKVNDRVLIVDNYTKIIKKRGRPVIIPLTKKEYLEFLVKRMSLSLQTGQENLKKMTEDDLPRRKQQLQQVKKEYSDLLHNKTARNTVQGRAKFQSDSLFIHMLPAMIVDIQQNITKEKEAFSKLKETIAQYNREMNDHPADPAYVVNLDVREFPGGADDRLFRPLRSPDDRDAKPLFKFNPDYYNASLPKTSIQVILLKYHYSNFSPVFERKALERWFNEINTESLSKMIN